MSELVIKRLDSTQADFSEQMDKLLAWEAVSDDKVNQIVNEILKRVRATEGDSAVVEYTNRFDGTSVEQYC